MNVQLVDHRVSISRPQEFQFDSPMQQRILTTQSGSFGLCVHKAQPHESFAQAM